MRMFFMQKSSLVDPKSAKPIKTCPKHFLLQEILSIRSSALILSLSDQTANQHLQAAQVASMIENDDLSGVHILISVKRSSASRNRAFQSCSSLSRELNQASIVMSKNLFPIVSRWWVFSKRKYFEKNEKMDQREGYKSRAPHAAPYRRSETNLICLSITVGTLPGSGIN